MSIYYTGNGDKGGTSVIKGKKLQKSSPLIEALGDVDELSSSIGVALFYVRDEALRGELRSIQNDLFSIGAILASADGENTTKAEINAAKIEKLEKSIDAMDKKMPQLTKFVLPGGSEESSHLHLARSIARRAERKIVSASEKHRIDPNLLAYMNRLSSFLFTAALYVNHLNGVEESNPIY